jgi:hypothetical protein
MNIPIENFRAFKKLLITFFKSSRTLEEANKIIKETNTLSNDLLNILMYMSSDYKANENLKKISRDICIRVLRNDFEIGGLLEELRYAKDIGIEYIELEDYWNTILKEMNTYSDYDEVFKILLLIREKMYNNIKFGKVSNYTLETLNDYFNLEYIGEELCNKRYVLYGLFEYICDFIDDSIQIPFRESFKETRKKFRKDLKERNLTLDKFSNETTLELVKFLTIHFFIYLELSENSLII